MQTVFRDNAKTYLLMIVFGVLAGLSVVFFCELPHNELWDFYYWSSSTYGFWMCSTSLIVLFSEKRKCAAINAGIYIFLMFFITTIYKSFRLYWDRYTPFESLLEMSVNSIFGWLLYSIPAALLCAVLALVLWSGREKTYWGKLLRIMPAIFILSETIFLFYQVFTGHTKLFSAITDVVFLGVYIIVMRRLIKGNKLRVISADGKEGAV